MNQLTTSYSYPVLEDDKFDYNENIIFKIEQIETDNKEIVLALREIAAGYVTPENIDSLGKKEKVTSPYEISEILREKK